MKYVLIFALVLSGSLASAIAPASDANDLLKGIQSKINQVFIQAVTSKSAAPFEPLAQELDQLRQQKANSIVSYWQAYLYYYKAIFHSTQSDEKATEAAVDYCLELLEDIAKPNSEELALMSLAKGFSLPFKPPVRAPFISRRAVKYAEAAIAADSMNLRAYFVLGSNDFYTPKRYGGGKKAEKLLLKAVSLPAQRVPNDLLPSWGKEQAYELLIRFYLREERKAEAKQYFKEATTLFPQNYQISQLGAQLVD